MITEISKIPDFLKLEEEVKRLTKKYYKYKTKYITIKHPEKTEQILSDTSILKNTNNLYKIT